MFFYLWECNILTKVISTEGGLKRPMTYDDQPFSSNLTQSIHLYNIQALNID